MGNVVCALQRDNGTGPPLPSRVPTRGHESSGVRADACWALRTQLWASTSGLLGAVHELGAGLWTEFQGKPTLLPPAGHTAHFSPFFFLASFFSFSSTLMATVSTLSFFFFFFSSVGRGRG